MNIEAGKAEKERIREQMEKKNHTQRWGKLVEGN